MLAPAFAGFVTGGSLIVAIGAQNAFVLRQGLMRQHVTVVVLVCSFSDIVLIGVVIVCIGYVVDLAGWLDEGCRWCG